MLANLQNIFNPSGIVEALNSLEPMETTVMDSFFKQRPTHPMPLIGLSDLTKITRTVPVVRRDGSPISLAGEEYEADFIAPLPVKTEIPVSASELNDLRAMMQNEQAIEAWRRNKVEEIRDTARNTTEAICSTVMTTGRIHWPVQLSGGRTAVYNIDYGAVHTFTPDAKLTASSKPSDVFKLLRGMELTIKQSGVGGKIEFYAGSDVAAVLIDFADARQSTAEGQPVRVKLGDHQVEIGGYLIKFMDETYPDPLTAEWLPKLNPKTIMAVAVNQPGKVWYCAIDSISANNRAVPMHIIPVKRDDDSGFMLIGQTKPLPARTSRGTCLAVVVD